MPPVPKPKHKRAQHFIGAWRRFKDLSQDQVAEFLDIDQGTVSRFERGESPYDQDLLERLALLFGCEPSDLLNIDPRVEDKIRLVYSNLRSAPRQVQDRAIAVIEALLQTA